MTMDHLTRPTRAELVSESRELHSAGRTVVDEDRESLECRYYELREYARVNAKPRTAIEAGLTR